MNLARAIDAIPRVGSATERDALFPAPQPFQRVHRRDTGILEMWVGSAWQTVLQLTPDGTVQDLTIADGGSVVPETDGDVELGSGARRFAHVHAVLLTVSTSAIIQVLDVEEGFTAADVGTPNLRVLGAMTFRDNAGSGLDEPVTVGPADSGGTGFRALRVPNEV